MPQPLTAMQVYRAINLVIAMYENGFSWDYIRFFLKQHPNKWIRDKDHRSMLVASAEQMYPGLVLTRLGFPDLTTGKFKPHPHWPPVPNP